ncbi:Rpn family recombination-promoting nuclease/putative transposase [Alloalcanivorax xenomutans]|uniref:Rpn family recombination-promoting nuclease/putative transposase n=1 Tax=Alloalcanivorax xenomutans TaxID=1094342 RepID=UPI003D9BB738
MTDHDTSYKFLFAHAEMVRDLLLGFMEGSWVRELDFVSLEKVSDGYVSDDLRARHNDALWRVRWKREWLYIYLMLEFQSKEDRYMPVRIQTYLGLLYQDLIRRGELEVDGRLPAVLPIVLYNGRRRWRAATDLNDLIQESPEALHPYLPRQRFFLVDQGLYADKGNLRERNLVAAVFALENGATSRDMLRVIARLVDWLKDPEQQYLEQGILEWLRRRGPSLDSQVPWQAVHNLREAHSMLEDRVREWKAQFWREGLEAGMKKGRRQGLQKGRQEGRQEGSTTEARNILLRQLRRRFGEVPAEIETRLNGASREQLEDWIDRVYEVETVAAVFD